MADKTVNSKKAFKIVAIVYAVLLVIGIAVAVIFGPKLDINFSGGTKISYSYTGDIAEKDKFVEFPPKGYTNKGLNAAFIDTIRRVTPECVFCGKRGIASAHLRRGRGVNRYNRRCLNTGLDN